MQQKIVTYFCYKSLYSIVNNNGINIQYTDYQYLMKFISVAKSLFFYVVSLIFHCYFLQLILYQMDKNKIQNTS